VRPFLFDELIEFARRYPATIRDVIVRANTHPDITGQVTVTTRIVLTYLLARVSRTNGTAAIRARVDTLATEVGCSEKSVQRAISALRELGWMALPENTPRNEYGVFASRAYHFTTAFCALAGLPHQEQQTPEVASKTELSAGAVYVDLSFKKDQQEISMKATKAKGITLPPELAAAADEFQIATTGMARLRGLAAQAGQSLSHIIAVARQHLLKAGATKNRAYRYLETLISKNDDYEGRAGQLERLKIADQADKLAVENFIAEYGGRILESPDMRELVAVNVTLNTVLHRVNGIEQTHALRTTLDVQGWRERIAHHGLVDRGRVAPSPASVTSNLEVGKAALVGIWSLVSRTRGMAMVCAPVAV
jgi:hypothetical protein